MEDDEVPSLVRLAVPDSSELLADHAEADAILRGLLRWKLETTGSRKAQELLFAVTERWAKERKR